MKKDFALNLIKKTKEDYNRIAPHFSSTRTFLWADLSGIKSLIKKGDRILDIGCGNGRLTQAFGGKGIEYHGIDISKNLIKIAQEKYPERDFRVGDFLNLPYPDNNFDTCFMIASFHHIPSKEFRLKALKEVQRVLRKDGVLFLTVWSLWDQEKYSLYIIKEDNDYDIGDTLVLWKGKGFEISRYIHAFREDELKNLLKEVGFQNIKIKKSEWNFVVTCQKD